MATGVVSPKLRPTKVRRALARRYFERQLGDLPLTPGPPIVPLGSTPGGWELPDGVLRPGAICYCVGSGGDISFDIELIHRYGAIVRAVDPVPEYEQAALHEAAAEPNFSFRRAALAAFNGPVRMQVHHEAVSHSVSAAGLYDSHQWIEAEGRTLKSLMRDFGDERMDLLKVDVEGAEYELLPTLNLRSTGAKVFATQLHHVRSVRTARRLITMIEAQGFKLVGERYSVKLTFLRE